MAHWTGVVSAVELIVAHPVAVETSGPVAYMRVQERFIILGQGQVWRIQRMRVVQDMEGGRECGALSPEVVQEGVNLGNGGPHAELGAGSKEGLVEVDIASLEEGKEGSYFLEIGRAHV